MPAKYYNPTKHINNLIEDSYYKDLVFLRNQVSLACDAFFQEKDAPKIDLFMIARGVSSPMGKGSDSIPLPLTLGKQHVYLVDSAQFGMEPLVLSAYKMVYCYLPSFRGEDSDDRHLNQFYHCEAEMRGTYDQCMVLVEDLVKRLLETAYEVVTSGGFDPIENDFSHIKKALKGKFPVITYDDAEKLLKKDKIKNGIEYKDYGRVITSVGEKHIAKVIGKNELPVWIEKYDRDVVPFYQKPDPKNSEQVLNADLIFPSIGSAFGGEVVGLGQRQDSEAEMRESMKRQGVNKASSYGWYLALRNHPKYTTTSGFGLGIERFLTWVLGLESIADTAVYPVQKDIKVDY